MADQPVSSKDFDRLIKAIERNYGSGKPTTDKHSSNSGDIGARSILRRYTTSLDSQISATKSFAVTMNKATKGGDQFFDSLHELSHGIGRLGTLFAVGGALLTGVVEITRAVHANIEAYNKFEDIGQTFGGSMIDMIKASGDAGVSVNHLADIATRNGLAFNAFGKNFGKSAETARNALADFGFSSDQSADLLTQYAKSQLLTLNKGQDSTKQLTDSFIELAEQSTGLAAITGKNREDLLKDTMEVTNEAANKAYLSSLDPTKRSQLTGETLQADGLFNKKIADLFMESARTGRNVASLGDAQFLNKTGAGQNLASGLNNASQAARNGASSDVVNKMLEDAARQFQATTKGSMDTLLKYSSVQGDLGDATNQTLDLYNNVNDALSNTGKNLAKTQQQIIDDNKHKEALTKASQNLDNNLQNARSAFIDGFTKVYQDNQPQIDSAIKSITKWLTGLGEDAAQLTAHYGDFISIFKNGPDGIIGHMESLGHATEYLYSNFGALGKILAVGGGVIVGFTALKKSFQLISLANGAVKMGKSVIGGAFGLGDKLFSKGTTGELNAARSGESALSEARKGSSVLGAVESAGGKKGLIGAAEGIAGKAGGVFGKLLSGFSGLSAIANGLGAIGFAGALMLTAKALEEFGKVAQDKNILYILGGLTTAIGALTVFGEASGIGMGVAGVGLGIFAGALYLTAKALGTFGDSASLVGNAIGATVKQLSDATGSFVTTASNALSTIEQTSGNVLNSIIKTTSTAAVTMSNAMADNVMKLSTIKGDDLIKTADGISAIGSALLTLGAKSVVGSIGSAFSKLFESNPVEQFKAFADIGNDLMTTANAVGELTQNLKSFSDLNIDDTKVQAVTNLMNSLNVQNKQNALDILKELNTDNQKADEITKLVGAISEQNKILRDISNKMSINIGQSAKVVSNTGKSSGGLMGTPIK